MATAFAPGVRARGLIDQSVRKILKRTSGKPRTKFLEFLHIVRARSDLLRVVGPRGRADPCRVDDVLAGLLALSRSHGDWLRSVESWEPRGAGPLALFSSLAHHLTAEYPAPPVLLSVWFEAERGASLRDLDLPIRLTRCMAHAFATAPVSLPVVSVPRSPVAGVPRTGSALKADPHHAFPDIVDNFAGDAQRFSIPTKGPGGVVIRQSDLYQLEGSLRGKPGIFEWVVDQGAVTHRRFIPRGQVTGFPNQVPGAK